MNRTEKWVVGTFVTLYVVTSAISTIHSVDFFSLANPKWLAISMAIAFEIGAAACLAAIVILNKTTRWMVWTLFMLVTGVQLVGNAYYAYSHLADIRMWSELFGLIDQEPMLQKRVMSIIAGGILPLVALGFVKSLVDLVKPAGKAAPEALEPQVAELPSSEAAASPSEVPSPSEEVNTYPQGEVDDEAAALARIRRGSV